MRGELVAVVRWFGVATEPRWMWWCALDVEQSVVASAVEMVVRCGGDGEGDGGVEVEMKMWWRWCRLWWPTTAVAGAAPKILESVCVVASTNVISAPREPFVFKQDHGVNPPHIDEINSDSTTTHSDISLPDYEVFYFDDDHIEEISNGSTTTHSDISLPDYEVFYFDDDHIEEISSGFTTTHSDISPSEYDSFIFDLSKDQFPPTDRSDFTHEENLPDPGELVSILNSRIRENLVNLPVEDDHTPLLAYVVWIFLAYLTFVNLGYLIEVADGKKVEVDRVIRNCKLELGTSLFTINLIPLGHGSFDMIVGMDWLSEHKAEIVCHEKVVRIPLESDEILIVQGERTPRIAKALSNVKDLSGLPPQQQVEFRIDLVPRATPVAKSPYRLAPLEMRELSAQLQELELNKLTIKNRYPLPRIDDLFDQL
nr:putative reverse transcriptase domain-containing protein [Tanacetum cinerariifolium]